jgi:acetyl esterase/lipase
MASFFMKAVSAIFARLPIFGGKSFDLYQVRAMHSAAARLLPYNPFLKYDWLLIKDIPVLKISAGKTMSKPSVLFVHGGGFFTCSVSTHRYLAERLARRLGTNVYSVEYTLSPDSVWPQTVTEILNVYDWIGENNPGHKIFFSGDSAGGNLALSAALNLRDRGIDSCAGLILFSPITRLCPLDKKALDLKKNDVLLKDIRADWVATYAGDTDPAHPGISVANAHYGGFPPVFLCAAENELLFDDAKVLYKKLLDSGNKAVFHTRAEAFHVFPFLDPFCPESRAAMRAAARFFLHFSPAMG